MMAALAFLLECSATAALIGMAVSLLVWPALRLLQGQALQRVPALRADLAFVLGTLPALASLGVVAAAAAPPFAAALGLAADHCLGHGHHVHLCFLHSAHVRPVLATVGAFSLAVFLFRAGETVLRLLRMRARLSALESLGTRRPGRFPIVAVPGAPRLCHAVGLVRRRILLSASLAESLTPAELRSALAHEEAHLRRRDPLLGVLLGVAGLFAAPFLSRACAAAHQMAAEEACDAEAAAAVGDGGLVAGALVKVAALQQRLSHVTGDAPAFGALALERRVRLLLDEAARATTAHALRVTGAVALATGLLSLAHSAFLHHAVETALHILF
ncbi:M56 family metallopeptidase [Archangium lipolyticum]|uniref:M56 family metallopeptidase n=1 Tax=Archangium lipolyticum TaxID=2970465 RepID=UPI002149BE15|nr:M56 family metallopeptidase [Archangium lipolyticum]